MTRSMAWWNWDIRTYASSRRYSAIYWDNDQIFWRVTLSPNRADSNASVRSGYQLLIERWDEGSDSPRIVAEETFKTLRAGLVRWSALLKDFPKDALLMEETL